MIHLEKFENADFTPIAMDNVRQTYQNYYKGIKQQRHTTTQLKDLSHDQNIRYPCAILHATNPARGQYLLTSTDATRTQHRNQLRDQIALLRASRTTSLQTTHKISFYNLRTTTPCYRRAESY